MTNLLKPKIPQSAAGPASAAPITIAAPKTRPQRMPFEGDTSGIEAARRTRDQALRRRGRMSTIMTDQGRDAIGSSGQSLGS